MNLPDNFPVELVKKIDLLCTPQERAAVLAAWTQKRHTTLRLNTVKTDQFQFEAKAVSENIVLQRHPFYSYAYILVSPELRQLTETTIYTQGLCYVQSFSSMIPPLVLAPLPNERILDICAAPGSKTTQMAMMMNNTGEIVANDSSHIRIYKLKANLALQGVTNVSVHKGPGQTIWQKYPEYFDRVLVDVPCSMEGRIHFSDPKSYTFWSPGKVRELVQIQRFLLKAAISACKPGGTIVYSTCTLSPEENEGVIDWILEKQPHVSIDNFQLTNVPFLQGKRVWKEKTYHESVQETKRILPSMEFEGFYIAKLKKL